MTALELIAFLLVDAGALAVVLTRDPLRQAIVLSVYGTLLAVLFLVLQAPDVALAEIGVGAVLVPALIVLTLLRARGRQR